MRLCDYPDCGKRHYAKGYCCSHYYATRNAEIRQKANARQRKWHSAREAIDPDGHRAKRREYRLKFKYGIGQDEYETMYNRQDGKCAITGLLFSAPGQDKCSPTIDHCHRTGKIRGLIRRDMNSSLGLAHDSPKYLRNAADYIECFQILHNPSWEYIWKNLRRLKSSLNQKEEI